jgi:hypothetical protein
MQKVAKATRQKSAAIPRKVKKCMVCSHPRETDIYKDKMSAMSHVDIAKTYFAGRTQKTVENALARHFKKHINVQLSASLLPIVIPAKQGTNLSVSTQRIFDKEARKRVNAQADIEAMLSILKDRINVLEDEFLAVHLVGKCDHCGRADSPFNDVNTKKFVSLVKTFNDLVTNWLKIKNPKAVIKYFFDSTFLKFVQNMMAHYVSNLQEKGRLIRQAVNEYSEGKISHQLLLRRVTEVEDMGSQIIAEKGIMELRAIQVYIDTEFNKQGWGS